MPPTDEPTGTKSSAGNLCDFCEKALSDVFEFQQGDKLKIRIIKYGFDKQVHRFISQLKPKTCGLCQAILDLVDIISQTDPGVSRVKLSGPVWRARYTADLFPVEPSPAAHFCVDCRLPKFTSDGSCKDTGSQPFLSDLYIQFRSRRDAIPGSWIDRPVGPELDEGLLRNWVKAGAEEQTQHCQFASPSGPLINTPLRLIDCDAECLILRQQPCSYIALSYVWGPNPDPAWFTLRRNNLSRVLEPGGLLDTEGHGLRLPRAIRESMQVVKKLGLRYLWVDAVCIIQDDDADRSAFITCMNKIYRDAFATLILTNGIDSDSSVPGVSPRTTLYRTLSYIVSLGKVDMRITIPRVSLRRHLISSRW
jgi:hypothetical protein